MLAARCMEYVPTIAARIREDPEPLHWSPVSGGWVNTDPPGSHIKLSGNRNLHDPESPDHGVARTSLDPNAGANGGYGFGGRAPKVAAMGTYDVKDKSSETYAYSGARGIFQQSGKGKYVPPHYQLHTSPPRPESAPNTQHAPGTNTPLKGGWPTMTTYGEIPFRGGFSIVCAVVSNPGPPASAVASLLSCSPNPAVR